ncbi:MAG TPA: hypothetical protein VF549_02600 [Solirubrobacteraceae bacterium]
MGAATGAVTASGDRAVAIGGDVSDSIIVTGDHATVRVVMGAEDGARLERMGLFARSARRRRTPPLGRPPPPPERHVDREDVLRAIRRPERAINVHGPRGIGKSWVTRVALEGLATPCVFLDAKGRAADDLLQDLFDAFWATEPPAIPVGSRLRAALAEVSALIVVDGFDGPEDDAARLAAAAPACRMLLTSRERVLWEGAAVSLRGLDAAAALEVVAQELGRAVRDDEREAVERIRAAVDGHPLRLRQVVARAVEEGRSPAEMARGVEEGRWPAEMATPAGEVVEGLSPDERRVVAALALFGEAAVGVERLAEITGVRDVAAVLERLRAGGVATAHSPRWSLLVDAKPDPALLSPALTAYTRWAASADGRDVVLEQRAILALLARAADAERDDEVVALARAADPAFAGSRRWGAWEALLLGALRAARAPRDRAWVRHQLGTRAFCLGDVTPAVGLLEEALAIQDAAVTRHNLRIARGGGGSGRPWKAAGLGLVAVAGVGVAVAVAGGGDDEPKPSSAAAPMSVPARSDRATNATASATRTTATATTTTDRAAPGSLTLTCPKVVKGAPAAQPKAAAPGDTTTEGAAPAKTATAAQGFSAQVPVSGVLEPGRSARIQITVAGRDGATTNGPVAQADAAGRWSTTLELGAGPWTLRAAVAGGDVASPPCTTVVVG